MEKEQAKRLVEQTFPKRFEKANFVSFIRNLLKHFDDGEDRRFRYSGNLIKDAFKERISHYERLGTFTDTEARKIDVLVIHLTKETTLERGRTFLRNFAADYLSNGRGNDKDAILAAYISPSEKDWRFSFVKLEYTRERDESGKIKDRKELTPAKRYSFLVGANERSHTAQTQFLPILQKTSDPTLSEIEESFKIETVTKEFFARYKDLFENVRLELNAILKRNDKVRLEFESKSINVDDFAKKLLGQIVFLYFLQKKGWFGVDRDKDWGDGDKHYLRNLFTKRKNYAKPSRPQNFFNDVLEPLFYEVLAKERDFDYYDPFDCKIPFLNGGLFEPLYDYDWVHKDILLPDDAFSNQILTKEGDVGTGILDVFDRYNFTVNEAEPLETEVAVDPEMLGKVFENLLLEDERQSKGAYYTPRVIVAYMCQQSLINYLATHLTEIQREDLEEYILRGSVLADFQIDGTIEHKDKHLPKSINDNAERIDKLLADVKICDPAIGSGAFPVGLLQEIVKARETLIKINKVLFQTIYEIKRHAIENSIYGVDLDSGAIEIAKLRLWLSLVVEEEDRAKIKALPNLDYKIMQGNSLLEEFRGFPLVNDKLFKKPTENTAEKIAELKRKIGEKSNEFFALYQKGTSELIKRNAVEKEVESLKKQLDDLTKRNDEAPKSSLLQGAEMSETSNRLNELEDLYEKFQDETRREQKMVIRQAINKLEHQIISENLDEIEARLLEAISKDETLLAEEIAHVKATLKGEVETTKIKRLNKSLESNHKELENINETRNELNEMDFAKAKPFFLWKLNFSKLFREKTKMKRGFDIVIANPPYVKESTNKEAFNGVHNSIYYQGKMDLWYLFACYSLDLLKPQSGILTFIAINNWVTNAGASKLRNKIVNDAQIVSLIDFFNYKIFESADIQTMVMVFRRDNNLKEYQFDYRKLLDAESDINDVVNLLDKVRSENYQYLNPTFDRAKFQDKTFDFSSNIESKLLNKIYEKGVFFIDGEKELMSGIDVLQDSVNKQSQLKLGYEFKIGDGIFVISTKEKERLGLSEKEKQLLKPYFTTKEIQRFYANNKNRYWIIYTNSSFKKQSTIESYPIIKAHLDKFTKVMTSDNKPYGLHRARNEFFFKGEKIMAVRKCATPTFSYVDFDCYVSRAFFVIKTNRINQKYLTGVLNSKIIAFWLFKKGKMQGFQFQVDKDPIINIPISEATEAQKNLIGKIVEYISYLKPQINEDQPREKLMISYFEQIIDALCYELYLTEEIHQAGKEFFRPLLAEKLPEIDDIKGDKFNEIHKIFDRLFHRDHIIRQNIFFLDTIESVRIIEGKV